MRKMTILTLALLLTIPPWLSSSSAAAVGSADRYREQIAGTLNILWEGLRGPHTPCVGIEFTDGTVDDAADGTVTMSGVSVSQGGCITPGVYVLTVSADGLTLSGRDVLYDVPLTLTRTAAEECFVGHWILEQYDYVVRISASPFAVVTRPAGGGAPDDGAEPMGMPSVVALREDVPEPVGIPSVIALRENVPNPFSGWTRIQFDLPQEEVATLRVVDVSGRTVRTLLASVPYPAGRHSVLWRGEDDGGHAVSSGVYFSSLATQHHASVRRMLLVK